MQLEKLLRDRDIAFVVTTADTGSMGAPRLGKNLVTRSIKQMNKDQVMDWHNFYPLHVIYSFLSSLEQQYPSRCTVHCIGYTVEGREIKMLKISSSHAGNSGAWLDGAIHAREWISAAVVTYIAHHLATHFDALPESVTNKDWYLVPVLNPDGYVHTHVNDRMWRKNRARHDNKIVGVDLNRNFGPSINSRGEGASVDPNHLNYRGPAPFSEPETAALRDTILNSVVPFKLFLTFHAFSEAIAFPWGATHEPCPDYVPLLEGATVMAKAIEQTSGRLYKVGAFKDIMYRAEGTSIDWSYGTAFIPFSYLIELRSKQHKFLLPNDEIEETCKEILSGVLALAEHVDKQTCVNLK
ncbi:hypothetical protein JYU34_001603 [Plutella xylostella]|uniref:Peptidase M14 domain-containing protein n=1 Tax=Plutella xylostella TaxID=51655 RepID=A0ABQ7R4B5_PLUXY|nr:hypothetical protein JYU34_001603 [Plutella xylostella]